MPTTSTSRWRTTSAELRTVCRAGPATVRGWRFRTGWSRPLATLAMIVVGWPLLPGTGLLAQAPSLRPDARFVLEFPELPKTIAGGVAAMEVVLPKDYRQDRQYPLSLWMNGGSGGSRTRTDLVPEGQYICIGWPLFHQDGKRRSSLHVGYEDAITAWDCYQTMLEKLVATVPNVKLEDGVASGFSNGAHMIGVLVTRKTKEFVPLFDTYILCEGGYTLRRAKDIRGKNLALIVGENSWGRRSLGGAGNATAFFKRFKKPRTNLLIVMEGAGHVGPGETEQARIRTWVEQVSRVAPK